MTIIIKDRVFETSDTQGTGTLNLSGPVSAFIGFLDAVSTGSKVPYFISDNLDWESGIGTITGGNPDTLSRDTILASSNNNAAVNWGPGTRNVRLGIVADLIPHRDENLNLIEGFGVSSGTANAQIVALPVAPLGYSDGMMIAWKSVGNITGPTTLNVGNLGDKPLKWRGNDISNAAFIMGDPLIARYDQGNNQFELLVPPRNVYASAAQGEKADTALQASNIGNKDDITAKTSGKIVDGENAKYIPGVPVAYGRVTYSSGTPILAGGHNVTSLTDMGTGRVRINLGVTMANTNYSVISLIGLNPGNLGTSNEDITTGRTTTSCGIFTYASGAVDLSFSFAIFGELAS